MRVAFILLAAFTTQWLHAQQYGWQVIARPNTTGLSAVDFVDTLHGWCAGRDSVYRTNDGGATWRGSSIPFGGSSKLSISFFDSLRGWAVGFFAGSSVGVIWRTTNGGVTWTEKQDDNRNYYGTAAQTGIANTTCGNVEHFSIDTGLVTHTTNAGTSWQEQRLAPNTRLGKVVFVDSLHGWSLKDSFHLSQSFGFVLRTTDGGVVWDQHPSPILFGQSVQFGAITFIDSIRGWAAFGGVFYSSTDCGASWDSLYTVPGPPINFDGFNCNDLSFSDSLYGWAFGDAFYQGRTTEAIYHTTNGGTSWYRESMGLTDDLGILGDGIMLDRTHGWAVSADGRVLAYRLVTTVAQKLDLIPQGFILHYNYPNPFNPTTMIEYEIPERSEVVVKVFDALGREVETLVNILQQAGVYRIRFDGSRLATGTYLYRLQAGEYEQTKQMILIK